MPCRREWFSAYRVANKETLEKYAIQYRAENREKARKTTADWRAANPGKAKASRAAWHANNKERMKAYKAAQRVLYGNQLRQKSAAYYAANKERVKESNATWAAANREVVRIHKQNRRARIRNNGGTLSRDVVRRLFALQRGKCACCGQPLGDNYHLDHIMPLALGGVNADDNVQLLRSACNLQKKAKHPVEFMQSRGFLL